MPVSFDGIMRVRGSRNREGFTLIELLIVVAIIAILAAIALPNFLEAQTRAKVTRVRSDLRTVGMALELFRVDRGMYPIASLNEWTSPIWPPHSWRLAPLTTPIAYLTRLPRDTFNPGTDIFSQLEPNTYHYDNRYAPVRPDWAWVPYYGHTHWSLVSYGPDQEGPDWATPYDPTNGSISYGSIIRVGP